jgi:hypothetical protein
VNNCRLQRRKLRKMLPRLNTLHIFLTEQVGAHKSKAEMP